MRKSISHNYKTEQDHKLHSGSKGSLKSAGLGEEEKGGSGDDNKSFIILAVGKKSSYDVFCD